MSAQANPKSHEAGVILALAAVFTLATLGAIAYFMLYVPIAKYTASELRLETEKICGRLAQRRYLAAELEVEFFREVGKIQLKNGRITRAVLYFNEMRTDQPNPGPPYYHHLHYTPAVSGGNNPGGPENLDTTPSVPLPSVCGSGANQIDCYTVGTLGDPAYTSDTYTKETDADVVGSAPTKFPVPESLVLRSYYSGNMIGCQLTAEINVDALSKFIKSGFAPAVAQVFYHQVPYTMDDNKFTPGDFQVVGPGTPAKIMNGTTPKVTIIIDPYLQTDYESGGNRYTPPAGFPDPTTVDVSALPMTFTSAYPPGILEGVSVDLNGDGSSEPLARVGINGLVEEEIRERLRACVNTPSMVRNSFLYHLLSYLVRDGFYRSNTAVYMTNPKHRVYFGPEQNAGVTVNASNAHLFHPGILNPPVLIGGLSEDLLSDSFEIPYINFMGPIFPVTTSGDGDYKIHGLDGDPGTIDDNDYHLTPQVYWDHNDDGLIDDANTSSERPMGFVLKDQGDATALFHETNKFSQGFTQPFEAFPNPDTPPDFLYPFEAEEEEIGDLNNTASPFSSPPVDRSLAQMQYHSIVSNQLRDCFGVYDNLVAHGGVNLQDSVWLGNRVDQFDRSWNDVYSKINGLINTEIDPAQVSHSSIWNQQLGADLDLNILEFVSMLGAAQTCPQATQPGKYSGEGLGGTAKQHCTKIQQRETGAPLFVGELHGDVFAALAHLAREKAISSYSTATLYDADLQDGGSPADRVPAILLPGLFYHYPTYCLGDVGGACTTRSIPQVLLQPYSPDPSNGVNYYTRENVLNCFEAGGCEDLVDRSIDIDAPPVGDNIIIIVTHRPPLAGEIDLYRKFLTGTWNQTTGTDQYTNSSRPLFESLYNERIAVVLIDADSKDHAFADAAATSWNSSLYGVRAGNATLGASGINFFAEERALFMMSPFGKRRFIGENAEFADVCGGGADGDAEPIESCPYETVNDGNRESFYQAYYADLLGDPAIGEGFGGDVRTRARNVIEWITRPRQLF